MTRQHVRKFLTMPLLGALLLAVACGGSSPVATPPQTIINNGGNVQPITVNLGPGATIQMAPSPALPYLRRVQPVVRL